MTVHVYMSTDYGAPALSSASGKLVDVFKACLVDGYGEQTISISRSGSTATITTTSPHGISYSTWYIVSGAAQAEYNGTFRVTPASTTTLTYTVTGTPATPATGTLLGKVAPAGWTTVIDATSSVLLQNAGSARYFKIKDDGYQTNIQTSTDFGRASITGAKNYSDINSLVTPFPRTISGTNRHDNNAYGAPVLKKTKWMIIADEATCYYLTNDTGMTSAVSSSVYTYCYGFGDLKLLGNVTSNPKAFVNGEKLNLTGGGRGGGMMRYAGLGGYMEHPLTGGAESTRFYIDSGYANAAPLLSRNQSLTTYNCDLAATIFPNPITGALQLQSFIICDDTNNIVRSTKHTGYIFERFATYAGFYGCQHSFSVDVGAYKVCDTFDTVTTGGRSYLIFNGLADYNQYDNGTDGSAQTLDGAVAIDITGPW